MARTLVIDQDGNRLGYIPGFNNFVCAYLDENGVPWLPIDGKAFYELASLTAWQKMRIEQLEAENLQLQVKKEFGND